MPFVEPQIGHHPAVKDVDSAGLANGSGLNSSTKGLSIPDRVALLYYKHGLLCSSYPWCTIIVAIIIVLTSCHPLLSLPFPGNEPEEISFPLPEKRISSDLEFGKSFQYPTRWGTQQPSFFIQQIVVRSSVNPWTSDLGMMDAFRGPLSEVFKLHSDVVGFHSPRSNLTLRDVCLYVESVAPRARSFQHLLPEFSCIILSPANLWKLDENTFRNDAQFLDTIFSFKNPVVEVRSSMADILYGVPLKNSGLKKFPVKTRSRVLTYAITILLKTHSEPFLYDLRLKLRNQFPLHSTTQESTSSRRTIVHIYYPERFNYLELIPLTFVYLILFLYIYFSVRKIEMVKSKFGMAFSAVVTVVASLGMSVGLCTWFGLRFTLQGRDIFPYLVVIVGLENILVLTRSVVSTPANLDVKIRVAQGLSREGWNITKNLLTEVTILTVGFFTFVPAIQEFCLFAVVALLSDFVLQMLFFSTVLSIDILRKELSEIQRQRRQLQPGQQYLSTNHTVHTLSSAERAFTGNAVHPHLRTRVHSAAVSAKNTPTAVVAPSSYTHNRSAAARVPRRIRIVHFWARTRLFQRTFMVGVVIWMSIFFYKYVVMENLADQSAGWSVEANDSSQVEFPAPHPNLKVSCSAGSNCIEPEEPDLLKESTILANSAAPELSVTSSSGKEVIDWQNRLQHPKNVELWRRLSYRHWPDLLDIYNISLAGKCIAMLPPIRISIPVNPERVSEVRNSRDGEYLTRSRWKSLASALDTLDVLDGDDSDFGLSGSHGDGSIGGGSGGNGGSDEDNKTPYVPSSPIQIILTTLLAIPSVVFIAYVTVVLYRCICSRHYAEWRSSSTFWGWAGNAGGGLTQESREYYSQIVAESMPLVLDGHRSPIECISTDGDVVSSVCLAGQLHIWDIQTGDAVAQIDRNTYFAAFQQQTSPASPNFPRHDTYSSTNELGGLLSHAVSNPIVFRSPGSFHSPPASPNNLSWKDRTSPTRNNKTSYFPSPVWCMQCFDGQVALGCANGRIEIWSHNSGLRCLYDDGSGVGVAKLKVCGEYLLAARLNGVLESFQFHADFDSPVEDVSHHVHSRRGADEYDEEDRSSPLAFRLVRLNWARAHQQPISVLDASASGSRVVTGSLDHCLKVWRLETLTALYCLHGHRGPITAMFIDEAYPCSASGSGSQDGMLCMWDLSSGTCVYSLQAHDGSVSVLTYTSSYVISLGADDKLCVWERFQGHLLNSLSLSRLALCGSLAMLNDRLLVTSRQGSLVVWDVRTGESIREVRLGDADSSTFVRNVMVVRDNVICDYGTQLRIVSFPMISTHKVE
ncbi:sterol regulatory element-binding protein cleavage-activating protein-like [Daphnia pulex]|uniref:sterol regulatory element-binding protein cleavage-activating protein-like n=1 Tax=Daphnia pulex TaxID=6669 RepID=UPI001EDF57DB|nr:sterol regulatory element-binding protein cleavage-activating protein-like [Daphnia pulex]